MRHAAAISLAETIERYRQDEIYAAARALDYLDEYAVADHEIQAYWAGRGARADHDSPGDGEAAAAGRPGQGAAAAGSAAGPSSAGPGRMPARAASSTVRSGQPAARSPGTAAGITGPPSHASLDFPDAVAQGVPACPASPCRQPASPAGRQPGEHRDAASRDRAADGGQRERGLASARHPHGESPRPDRELRGVPATEQAIRTAVPPHGYSTGQPA